MLLFISEKSLRANSRTINPELRVQMRQIYTRDSYISDLHADADGLNVTPQMLIVEFSSEGFLLFPEWLYFPDVER